MNWRPWSWAIGVAWALWVLPRAYVQYKYFSYDYAVYWQWVNGRTTAPELACPYPERAAVFFSWLQGMNPLLGWMRLYAVLVVAAGILAWRFVNGPAWGRWPVLGLFVLALAFTGPGNGIYGSLRCANVDLVLAALALSPAGAVVASCIKPQLWALVYLHAALLAPRFERGGWRGMARAVAFGVQPQSHHLPVRCVIDSGRVQKR